MRYNSNMKAEMLFFLSTIYKIIQQMIGYFFSAHSTKSSDNKYRRVTKKIWNKTLVCEMGSILTENGFHSFFSPFFTILDQHAV